MNTASQSVSRRHFLALAGGCAAALALGGSLVASRSVRAASSSISVYSREDGSGTRSAFVELFGLEETTKDGKSLALRRPPRTARRSTSPRSRPPSPTPPRS